MKNKISNFNILKDQKMDYLSLEKLRKAFINGYIYTVDNNQPLAEAVVIEGKKIIFIGDNTAAKSFINKKTIVINLNGRMMLPGFIDNHVHFIKGGFQLQGVDLRNARSTTEFKNILKNYVSKNKGSWITGGDWNHELWETNELPAREWIDEFSLNTPIFINRLDEHMGLANTYALKLAGITKDTPNPDGGLIIKDPDTGELTGILKDNAMNLVYRITPESSEEELNNALTAALEEAKKNGFTSVQDITNPTDLKTYRRFEKKKKLTCRIYFRIPLTDYERIIEKNIRAGYRSELLKLRSTKAFADGSLGSCTALFYEPYENDKSNCGIAMDILMNKKFKNQLINADKNKLQLSIHAIGDKANPMVLDLFEEIQKNNPAWDRRFRIEHAQHVRPEDILRFADLGIIASVQPYHAIDDGCWAEKVVGKKRLSEMFTFHSFLKKEVKVCFGSDWPVAPLNALYGIYAAVTRRTLDEKNPDGWIPEQKISVEEAIRCYTINNAYASFEEDIKGSIEVGKLADFVVLSDNILKINPVNIKNVRVEMTIFNGNVIYNG
jgi:predicted amidohydrolase YtcJ